MEAYDQEPEGQTAAADSLRIAEFATPDATIESANEQGAADVVAFRSGPAFDTTREVLIGRHPPNHSHEKLQAGHTLHLFPKLSLELRLLIWEQTWPEPRLIEAAICEDETTIEYEDVAILRFAGSLSTLLDVNFGTRIIEQGPAESCLPPVSLYVCHESRKYTLKQYRLMEHTNAKASSFYFNPRHDVLWFSFDFTDEPDYLRDLLRCYGEQLNDIESVLIEEAEWEELTPARYKSKYLSRLRGLKSITVLFRDDDDDDDDSVQDVDEENDGGEIANDEDNRELINRHDCSKELDTEVTKLQARADELKREYAKLSKNQDGIAKDFRCMDRCGMFY
ncbi:hypothetical protein DL95DRAFT_152487 [Leptodontidium sp. 2 PMI_412]|nr:hypothetical protein DL95DRAFT_152487 [Leptodontidium sp. 2 PMI_412]